MNSNVKAAIKASEHMDWQQVILNGGPPCFHICEDGRFCLRAKRWFGHKYDAEHDFVSMNELLTQLQSDETIP